MTRASRIARRPADIALVLAALLVPVLLRLAILPWTGVPQPVIHDEFSYLLSADTFASGRLANPPHPHWQHFEAPHVIQQPAYASKYFPGQGLILAFGQVAGGHPWAGVLLGMALMLGCTAWMLRGWLPWRWAVAGTALLALRYAPQHYWWNSYWGGGLVAAGGALVLGALPRLLRRPSVGLAVTGSLGLGILLLTRPHGAIWLAVPAAAVVWLEARRARRRGKRPEARAWLRRVLLPGLAALVPALVLIGLQDRAVTGDPLELPYMLHEKTYAAFSAFKWEEPRDLPPPRHEMLRRWNEWWLDFRERGIRPQGIARQARLILDLPAERSDLRLEEGHLTRSVFGVLLLLSLPVLLRDRRARGPVFIAGVAFVGPNLLVCYFEHYAAAWAGLRILLITRAAQRASAWWRWRHRRSSAHARRGAELRGDRPGRRRGRFHPAWLWAAPACAGLAALVIFQAATAGRPVPEERRITVDRPVLLARLARHAGRDLVLVRYAPDHDVHQQWIYNAATIDSAQVVWAWEMGPAPDAALREYYADRHCWLAEPDTRPPRLTLLAEPRSYAAGADSSPQPAAVRTAEADEQEPR